MTDHPINNESVRGTEAAPSLSQAPVSPELLRTLGALLGSNTTKNAPPPPESETAQGTAAKTSVPMSPDGLFALLSNPEMMERLPQLISLIKPMLGTVTPTQADQKSSVTESERDRLLLSLKPFLSQKRCEAIDNMLRIGKLGSVLQGLK